MVVQYVRIKTSLSEDEVLAVANERAPQFRAIPGLVQKYYVKGERPGEIGGIYVWDSRESLEAYRKSELAATIPQAYKVTEPPQVEVLDLLFALRD